MYTVSIKSDLAVLLTKRQMRSNESALFLIKGVNNANEVSDILKTYSGKCSEVFFDRVIEKPTYDEVQSLNACLQFPKTLNLMDVTSDISKVFSNLSSECKTLLIDSVTLVFSECIANKLAKSMIINGYIRCINTLNNRLGKITYNLREDNRILFVGKPDKYDILAFTVLGLCGTDVVICDFADGMTSECMCVNRFVLITGRSAVNLDYLKYINQGISDLDKNIAVANSWVNFNEYKTTEDILKLMSFRTADRFEVDKWKVLHIELQGVQNILEYSTTLDNFMINLKASKRPFVLFDNSISKPSYEEVEKYKNFKGKTIFDIFAKYPIFKNSGAILKVENKILEIVKQHKFVDISKMDSYKDTLKMQLIRYLDMFFTSQVLDVIPLVVAFNINSEKEKEILQILSCLPVDMLIISPNYNTSNVSESSINDIVCFVDGAANIEVKKYPTNTGVGQVATTAYNAEQELNTLLYTDTSLFRIKQFKNVNPIVLKTTYEEVSLLWNEPSKFRSSFDSVGDLVTVPTIFVKVNGVNNTYLSDIKKLMGSNTLFYQDFPIQLQPSKIDHNTDFRGFTKQIVFKDSIDFERLVKSPFYTYGVYSEETQQLIIDKVKKLVSIDWCSNASKNLVYDILDVVFRLPANIMQMIHNFDFTGDIPKIVIYNGSNQPCSLSDCILLMFLKLIGFDIVVFAPTGYRVIEQYISNQWFNENTIGEYNFNMVKIDLNSISDSEEHKKSGFFSRLFQ